MRSFQQIWDSPTFASWASTLARTSSVVVLLPLILVKFSPAEVALWYLFATLMGLQMLAEMGFGSSFGRVVAYAVGGSDYAIGPGRLPRVADTAEPNWKRVSEIAVTMNWLYRRLAIAWLILFLLVAVWSTENLLDALDDPNDGLIVLGLAALGSSIRLMGGQYVSLLFGLNRIADQKRWEAFIWTGSILVGGAVLILDGGLLELMLVFQTFVVLNVWINKRICNKVLKGTQKQRNSAAPEMDLVMDLWPRVWRSGVGILMSAGVIQGSGIVYARLADSEQVAAYLLALNVLRVVSQFSQAPFYSKLPLMAQYWTRNEIERLRSYAQRGIKLAFWVLALGLISVDVAMEILLGLISANARFVEPELWLLMGTAAFLERYGAMHLQMYSTTNTILWHVANGWTGLIYLAAAIPLFALIGVYSFPIAQIIACVTFFDWYCARLSYRQFELPVPDFERNTSALPIVVWILYAAFAIVTNYTTSENVPAIAGTIATTY